MREIERKLLVVEDDVGLQRQLKWAFDGYEVFAAGNREDAIAAARRHEPVVILQDLGLPPDADGVDEGFATIGELQQIVPAAKIIVVTGREGEAHAVRAIGMGAWDFCQKPVDTALLKVLVDRAMRIYDLENENRRLHVEHRASTLPGVVASSDAMLRVCRMIEKLAPTQASVLILGESGTGKERLARALHALSGRAAKPMIAINCAAIPENLLESELFGYERGAFTGAVKQTRGKIECADGGTLFLDEIGDMPMPLQAKMLRFLQDRTIERIGGREPIPVDVRIVTATNKDLAQAIEQQAFRADLFYRISEVSVSVPPLKDRDGDAIVLANFLLHGAVKRHNRAPLRFTQDALRAIEAHAWPGNVRELENRVNRAVIMAEGKQVTLEDLGLAPVAEDEEIMNLREVRQRAETHAVRRALAIASGNVSRAAELLGITRPTLYDLMERAQIKPAEG